MKKITTNYVFKPKCEARKQKSAHMPDNLEGKQLYFWAVWGGVIQNMISHKRTRVQSGIKDVL